MPQYYMGSNKDFLNFEFEFGAMKCPFAIATIITTTMRTNYHAAMQLCNNGTEDMPSDAENIILQCFG